MAARDPYSLSSDWNDYFIGVAHSVASKSKDPKSKVGAVIVNQDALIISTGFNGLPRRIPDDNDLLEHRDEKLLWIVHAEHNAIINAARSGVSTLGCIIYVNKFPCFACLLAIVQAGIQSIYTDASEYWRGDPLDGEGGGNDQGKRYIIEQAALTIIAPNHPDYPSPTPSQRPQLAMQQGSKQANANSAPAGGVDKTQASSESYEDITKVRPRSAPPARG